jgi:aerobic-type carbon monoxide dehydrogenase small subunit (CoxS/CutS family)
MAEGSDSTGPEPAEEHIRPLATRRDFLVGAGAGAVAVGVVAGAGIAVTRGNSQTALAPAAQTGPGGPAVAVPPAPAGAPTAQPGTAAAPQPAAAPAQAPAAQLPPTMRRVSMNIDGITHDVTVDVRDSLWETMTRGLNMASSNLGCDRAQCGACTVVVDGRAVNGCSIYSARLGRGQKIMTVASLATGLGVDGLHPIQRAFWADGGFQCGICTRGFIMSTYALLTANPKPTDDDITEGLAGNICRCGEYSKIYTAVRSAAAEMSGAQVTQTAPLNIWAVPAPQVQTANTTAAQAAGTAKDFEFVIPLSTIEDFEPMAEPLKTKPGIIEISGSQATVTVKWDPSKTDEAAVRQLLADAGHPVK